VADPEEMPRAKTSKQVQPYPPEFRAEAIRLARTSGKSHRRIADDLGMTSETSRLWLTSDKQADLDDGRRQTAGRTHDRGAGGAAAAAGEPDRTGGTRDRAKSRGATPARENDAIR
jgi:transposase-like protein